MVYGLYGLCGPPVFMVYGLYGLCGRKATLHGRSELKSCVKVEVAVLGSPSLTVLMVSADVKRQ